MRNFQIKVVTGMRMKILVPALLAATFAVPAMADQYTDTARVLSATPQTERVNMPRQECRTEYQQQSYSNGNNRSLAGAVIGGIAGGLLGNTIGRGNGRIAATAVGAGVGAIAGDRIDNNRYNNNVVTTRSVPVQNCYQVDNWQTVNSGYLVTYEYNDRIYSTVTDSYPGKYIDVSVAVSPGGRVVLQNAPQRVTQLTYVEPIRYDNPGWDRERRDHGKHRGWDKRRDWDDRNDDDRYY